MSNLHIVRSSAFQSSQLQQCLLMLHNDDRVFLIDDGAYNVNHPLLVQLNNQILVLDVHLSARNITLTKANQISASYIDLVTETENAENVITWQ